MIEYPKRKGEITRLVLDIIKPGYGEADYRGAMNSWWRNIRPSGGLALSKDGHVAFNLAELESWDIPIDLDNIGTPESMLRIVRGVECPHYLSFLELARRDYKRPTIRIFDSKIATVILLHGSLDSYLKSVEGARNGKITLPGGQRINW